MAHIYNSQLDAYSLYHLQKEAHHTPTSEALPALGHALAGSTGTAISNLCIYPLDLVITRLQVQRQLRKSSTLAEKDEYKGVLDAFQQIYEKEGGISAFYSGILADTGKSIADSFLFFLFYNYLREKRLAKHGTKSLPALDELGVGALAGACSKFFTTPISNIVTRKQTASMISHRSKNPSAAPNTAEIIDSIRSEKGLKGFWSGYSASLVLTLNPSLTFFLHSFFTRTLIPRSQRDDPGARATFLLAAISKAIASTITYPFSLAKARAQTSSSKPIQTPNVNKKLSEADKQDAKRAGRAAARSTVFSTILDIYRTEGAAGLYEGVFGEILKGFFSHGITMIVKEYVHKLIIKMYFLLLRALNKAPSPKEAVSQATEAVQDAYEKAGHVASQTVTSASETSQSVLEQGREKVGELMDRGKVVGENINEAAKSMTENSVKTAAAEGVNVEEYASREAGHLLGNAQAMVGGKVKED